MQARSYVGYLATVRVQARSSNGRPLAALLCLCALLAGAAHAQPLTPPADVSAPPAEVPATQSGVGSVLARALPSAQSPALPSAPAGLVEAGVPSFKVLGTETLGLSSPPTDIHLLPDGRTLIVAAQELAIGDGVRWQTFRRRANSNTFPLDQVVVDRDGAIYASVPGQFTRIEFGPDAQWSHTAVASFPPELEEPGHAMSQVSKGAKEWYWHSGGGALVAWHPGRMPMVVGRMNDYERVIPAGGKTLVSDPSIGAIFSIEGDALVTLHKPEGRSGRRGVVCGVALPGGLTLLGTENEGAFVFDGTTLKPWTNHGPLDGRYRIADLCAAGAGYYCAAVDNLGLVFFDSQGRVVQVLDRSIDHRLNRVGRLLQAPGGGVWALLNDGLAQVEFPSRFSRFDPIIASGLTEFQACRHDGRLWLVTDGKIQRAIYDDDGRLLRFDTDTSLPRVYSAASAGGRLVLSTASGIFQRVAESWKQVLAEPRDALTLPVAGAPDRWLYAARGEVGWLRFAADGPVAQRFPVPGLGDAFGTLVQNGDVFWAELGRAHVARIQAEPDGRLTVRLIGAADGMPDGWIQAYLVDGVVRFNTRDLILRFDETTGRIVPDPDFLKDAPALRGGGGRPMRDALGRLWVMANQGVAAIDERLDPTGSTPLGRLPPDFRPTMFVMEDRGVVWMQRSHRLIRFDPAIPEVPEPPLQALIGQVHLTWSNHHWVSVGKELPSLDYRDNSLVAQFLAPNAPFGRPVSFESLLEGTGGTWAPAGSAGSASFTGLKEGRYVLHVRPRSGEITGTEATLAFTIRPPWFRTPLAYGAYALGILAVVLLVAWASALMERREKARLEKIVAQRTGELHESNQQLAQQVAETLRKASDLQASEERYRRLSEDLEGRVQSRTAELESFSYSVSHDLRAPLRNISGFADLLHKRLASQLVPETRHFLDVVSTEAVRLGKLIDSLLAFSRLGRSELRLGPCDLGQLVEAVREELRPAQEGREVEWRIGPLPIVEGDPTLLRQVFANLLGNALKFSRQRHPAVIEIGVLPAAPGDAATVPAAPAEHVLFVRDNGAGFKPEYVDKLFGVFQRLHSAKEFEGTGIGLANVRRIVARHGGRVWATGAPDQGATFFVALPADRPAAPSAT